METQTEADAGKPSRQLRPLQLYNLITMVATGAFCLGLLIVVLSDDLVSHHSGSGSIVLISESLGILSSLVMIVVASKRIGKIIRRLREIELSLR